MMEYWIFQYIIGSDIHYGIPRILLISMMLLEPVLAYKCHVKYDLIHSNYIISVRVLL